MIAFPPCLDCREPLTRAPMGPAYPKDAVWSSVYLCPFCRINRYKSEAHAIARCLAGLERLRATGDNSMEPSPIIQA